VLELAPELAECEAAVCHGREDSGKRLAAKLLELKAVQERLRDGLCQQEGVVAMCHEAIAVGAENVALYDNVFKIVSRQDAIGLAEYQREAAALTAKCDQAALECTQAQGDLSALYEEAAAARPAARAAMEALNSLGRASLQKMGPLKRMSRASEKIVLQPDGSGGAERICDVVRDMFECASFTEMAELVKLIVASPAIEIIRSKDRIAHPSGGWRDAMINYRVKGTTHVCELQIVHRKMLMARKDLGGHEAYGYERNAREVLEYMGNQGMSVHAAMSIHDHDPVTHCV